MKMAKIVQNYWANNDIFEYIHIFWTNKFIRKNIWWFFLDWIFLDIQSWSFLSCQISSDIHSLNIYGHKYIWNLSKKIRFVPRWFVAVAVGVGDKWPVTHDKYLVLLFSPLKKLKNCIGDAIHTHFLYCCHSRPVDIYFTLQLPLQTGVWSWHGENLLPAINLQQ